MHVSGRRIRGANDEEDTPEAAVSSLPQGSASIIVKENRFYYPLGCTLSCLEDNRYEFKGYFSLTWSDILKDGGAKEKSPHSRELPRNVLNPNFTGKKPISRSLCAMANSPDGGVVLCGVTDSGQVGGLPFSVPEKEHIMLALGNLFSKFKPPLAPDRYLVSFVPVLAFNEIDAYIDSHSSEMLSETLATATSDPVSIETFPIIDASYDSRSSNGSSYGSQENGDAHEFLPSKSEPCELLANAGNRIDYDSTGSYLVSDALNTIPLLTSDDNPFCPKPLAADCMNQPLLISTEGESGHRASSLAEFEEPDRQTVNGSVQKVRLVDDADRESVIVPGSLSSNSRSNSSSELLPDARSKPHDLNCLRQCWCAQQRMDRFTDGIATRRYVLRIEMLPQSFRRISLKPTLNADRSSNDETDAEDDEALADAEDDDELFTSEPLSISMPTFVENEENNCFVRSLGANKCISLLHVQQLAESRALAVLDAELMELRRELRELRLLRTELHESF